MSEPCPPASIPPQDLGWDELLDSRPQRTPDEIRGEVNEALGIGTRRVRYGDHPDVGQLRRELEI